MFRPNLFLIAVLTLTVSLNSYAQSGGTPFKLGSFEENGRAFVGIVLDGDTIIDIASANTELPRQGSAVPTPDDMKDLISRYRDGLRARLIEIIDGVSAMGANNRPAYVHSLDELEIMPPVMYPRTVMNTALNYTEHALEMEDVRDDGVDAEPGIATSGDSRPGGIWEPESGDRRWNPYMFLKSPSAIIAHGEAVQIPVNRTEIDWECELGVVIARTASNVPLSEAEDYIFGYTMELDVSDRQDRGDTRYGSDWLIGKSRDTFAPMGPFITPREFVADPTNLEITFALNGNVM